MIEVFRTNVEEVVQARRMVDLLLAHFPGNKINIDLHDCDRVLRIEGNRFAADEIMGFVKAQGFRCDLLE